MNSKIIAFCFVLALLSISCRKFATHSFEVNQTLKVPKQELKQIQLDSLEREEYQQALAHAPILWFADREEYFPTLPFFSAFDGVDNNFDGRIDFADPQEIAPTSDKHLRSLASLDSLHLWYRSFPKEERQRLAFVFYKVDSVSAHKVGNILFSDEQIWMRMDKKVKAYLNNNYKWLTVYQYYFYYIHDQGLQGHPEDLEHTFIFVPQDTLEFFKVSVGAGHSDFVPNNVVLYNYADHPLQWGSRHHLLVELGGHSNAPDLNGNGRFDPGVDVNWHTENFWGTRDVQSSAGLGATAKYQNWMTFDRSNFSQIYPPDSALLEAASQSSYFYRLVPSAKFKTLDSLLSRESQLFTKDTDFADTEQGKLKAHLKFLDRLGISANDSIEFSQEALLRMSLWTDNLRVRVSDEPEYQDWSKDKHKVWKKRIYNSSPADIFKNYLFRPRRYGGLGLWTQFEQASSVEFRVAWMTPAWAWRLVPMKVDGVTEIHLGWKAPGVGLGFKREKWVAAFYYERFYARLLSWYANLKYINNNPDFSSWSLGGGISLQLPFVSLISKNPLNLFHWMRLRTGIKVPLEKNALRFDQTHLELQLGIHY